MIHWSGTDKANYYFGSANIVFGYGGNDFLSPSSLSITYIFGGTGSDTIRLTGAIGGAIFGERGNDTMRGSAFQDYISGGRGRDTILGGGGDDILSGGRGADSFRFAMAPGDGVDTIVKFVSGKDQFVIGAGNPSGSIPPQIRFVIGDEAATSYSRVIYDDASGILYYDPDGTGEADKSAFAVVAPGTTLLATDFLFL